MIIIKKFLHDYWSVFILPLIAGLILSVVFVFIGESFSSSSCSARADILQFKSTYSFFAGCMIEYKPNKWIPLSQFRVIE